METAMSSEAPAAGTSEMSETGQPCEPCIICKEPLELDRHDDALALQCGHTYHAACLNEWWTISHSQQCVACTRVATAYRHACGAAAAAPTLLRPGHALSAPRPCAACGQQQALLARRPGRGDGGHDDDDDDEDDDSNDAALARLARALRAARAAGAPLTGLLDPEQQRSYDALLGLLARPDCSPTALVAYLDQEGEGLALPESPGQSVAPLPSPSVPLRPASPPSAASAAHSPAHTTNITKAVFAVMYSWLPGPKKEAAGDLRLVAEVKPPAAPAGSTSPASPPSWVRELCSQYCQRARVLKDWQDEYQDPAASVDVYFELLCAFEAFWSVVQMVKAAGRGEDRRAELELDLARRLASLMCVKERGLVDDTEQTQATARRACPLLGRPDQ